ncbi:hypothetical protein BGZ94_006395 [Podila epigama]|nr:hypothetical protein BGZ94_006395 [Podila epigama]
MVNATIFSSTFTQAKAFFPLAAIPVPSHAPLVVLSSAMQTQLGSNIVRSIQLGSMIKILTSTGHLGIKFFICLLIHLAYFQGARFAFPSLRKNKRKLSWILTWVSTSLISLSFLITYFQHARTILHAPVPYELYDRPDPVTGVVFHRYDIPFRPTATYNGVPMVVPPYVQEAYAPASPDCDDSFLGQMNDHVNCTILEPSPCQCTDETYRQLKIAFYREVDAKFYAPVSAPDTRYPDGSFAQFFGRLKLPPIIFLDSRLMPGKTAFTEWVILFFAAYLIQDLILGCIYYRERITLFTGWFHHLMHVFISYTALHTDAALPLTLFLGAESKGVMDWSFSHEYVRNRGLTPLGKFEILIKIPLNIKFFVDWIQQQRRLRRRQMLAAASAENVGEQKPN